MNPKAIRIISYMLERFLERQIEVVALPPERIKVSKDKMSLQHEVHLRVTKDLNLAISSGTLLGLVQKSTGLASGVVKKGKPISPTEFFMGSTIIGGIWQELVKENSLEDLTGLRVGIEGLDGHIRICADAMVRAEACEKQEPKSMRREINSLPEIRHFFESLSRSHKIAQLCQNLQRFPEPVIRDMIKSELPAVGALLLRFIDEQRKDDVIKGLEAEMKSEIQRITESGEISTSTELMLATLGFLTYAPLTVQSPGDHSGAEHEQKHLAKVH